MIDWILNLFAPKWEVWGIQPGEIEPKLLMVVRDHRYPTRAAMIAYVEGMEDFRPMRIDEI